MAEKPEAPNKEPEAPNGLVVVLVEPNRPPLLVLVPKPVGNHEEEKFQKKHLTETDQAACLDPGVSLPNVVGLLAANALFCWEKSPPVLVPVPVFPKRLVEVPLAAPKPKPALVEDVAGWLKVLDPNRPPAGEEPKTPKKTTAR